MDLKEISYYKLIDYGTGRVDLEGIQSVFEIKSLELPMEEKVSSFCHWQKH